MNTTWQTVYEQLQEFLNECIIQWRQYKRIREYLYCTPIWLRNNNIHSKYYNELISYHDLFSKDSWFLQFLDRQYTDDYHTSRVDHAYDMVEMTAEEKCKYVVENAKLPTKSE